MDAKTRALMEAKVREQLALRSKEHKSMILLGASMGAEAMEALMLEREAKLVAAAKELRTYCLGSDASTMNMIERFDRVIAEHHAAKGEV